jgi:uncharacterized protein YjiS (DUF1127 family)
MVLAWRRISRHRRLLDRASDHVLADMGVSRAELDREFGRRSRDGWHDVRWRA